MVFSQKWRIKKPASAGFFDIESLDLLNLGFLVLDVLAHHRVVFFEHQFIRGVFFVFIGGVVVACARA
jgi:hypothetical protein